MALVRTLHRWLSVIVGIQLVIWIVTGLYFNLISDGWVSPNVYKTPSVTTECAANVASLNDLTLAKDPTYVEIKSNATGCYYLVHYKRVFQQYQAMDAETFDLYSGKQTARTHCASGRTPGLPQLLRPRKYRAKCAAFRGRVFQWQAAKPGVANRFFR